MCDQICAGESPFDLLLEDPTKELPHWLDYLRSRKIRLVVNESHLKLGNRLTTERELVSEKVVDTDSERPDVNMFPVHDFSPASLHHFWGHVAHGALRANKEVIFTAEELTDAEVAQDQVVIFIEHHVLWLDVAVRYVCDLVAIMECGNQLSEVIFNPIYRHALLKGLILKHISQGPSR